MTQFDSQISKTDALWWRQATVYQIYPRSFADSNGDGIGDLQGIISHLPYLAKLGIDAIWLSPFYPSELADGGYDVIDYRNVDSRLGTLADFDEMIAKAHSYGIKFIVDIVPNHTSHKHIWFMQALRDGRGSAARKRYIFREGKGKNGEEPPSDWNSVFGGPSWTRVADGQWYLHTFAREQPDLNWDHHEVREEFLHTLKFWADRGVDGFRIDVAHALVKDLSEPLLSQAELDALPTDNGRHPLMDRDELQDVYAQWRALFNQYDPPKTAVAEAWVDAKRVPRYANKDSLGQCFNFDLLESDFDANQFKKIIQHNLSLAKNSDSSSTWVLSNHDVVRHATRYGLPNPPRKDALSRPDEKHGNRWLLSGGISPTLDREKGLRRARAATLLILGLPGSTYLYQGEELGLHEVAEIPPEFRQDPTFFRTGGKEIGRDGCRVPLPWKVSGKSYGFSDGVAHLPQPSWFSDCAVEIGGNHHTLQFYQRALMLRKKYECAELVEWRETSNSQVLHFIRPNGWEIITNFSDNSLPLTDEQIARVVISSWVDDVDNEVPTKSLTAESTIWLKPKES